MNKEQQASIIVSNLYRYKHQFMQDFILNEGKYISDKFSEVSNAIEKRVKDDLSTGTFYINQPYYINYCYNPETSEPVFALPFQKKHHPINIVYINDKNDFDVAYLYIDDLTKCIEDDYPINIHINLAHIKDNKYFFVDLSAALPDEFTHIVQLYKIESIEHSPENTLYQTFARERQFLLDKQQEKIVSDILYLFCTYENEAHVSSVEFNIDKILTKDDIQHIKRISDNDKKIQYIATLTSREHSLGLFKNAMELLKRYIDDIFDFIPVLVIAYYLQKAKIIDTQVNKNDIDSLYNLKTTIERQVFFSSNREFMKKCCDTAETVTNKIYQTFISYKNEIFTIISQYLIDKHLLDIDIMNEKTDESLYEEINKQFKDKTYLLNESLNSSPKYEHTFPKPQQYYIYD